MMVVLVHWTIEAGRESEFIRDWRKKFRIKNKSLLTGEVLCAAPVEGEHMEACWPDLESAPSKHSCYVTVGAWASKEAFLAQVGSYMEERDYEAAPRRRTFLQANSVRQGYNGRELALYSGGVQWVELPNGADVNASKG